MRPTYLWDSSEGVCGIGGFSQSFSSSSGLDFMQPCIRQRSWPESAKSSGRRRIPPSAEISLSSMFYDVIFLTASTKSHDVLLGVRSYYAGDILRNAFALLSCIFVVSALRSVAPLCPYIYLGCTALAQYGAPFWAIKAHYQPDGCPAGQCAQLPSAHPLQNSSSSSLVRSCLSSLSAYPAFRAGLPSASFWRLGPFGAQTACPARAKPFSQEQQR